MVPPRLPGRAAARAAGAAALAAALIAGCTGDPAPDAGPDAADHSAAERAVRRRYRSPDAAAAGAYRWTDPGGRTYLLVDVQSTAPGLVQARADLWVLEDTALVPVGRSDVMPAAAVIGAYQFEDLTGDGLPDLLGFVADSEGTGFALFMPGARGAMNDELVLAAPAWRFAADQDSLPRAVRDSGLKVCYIQLWVEAPAPDGRGDGWRFLPLRRDGRLGPPAAAAPGC